MTNAPGATDPSGVPALRIVRGEATDEELAALVVVLAARSGAGAESPPAQPSRWAARSAGMRGTVQAGPGAWRASGLPR